VPPLPPWSTGAGYTRKRMEATGLSVDLVTGAGTGTLVLETASGVYGELQAGSFLFMDADYAAQRSRPGPAAL
jgi:D-serine deaminase-like pyridoxal phosphate-dependent protein